MSNPLVHFQFGSRDPEATRAFFAAVFDWSFAPGAGRVLANIDTGARKVDPNDIYPSGSLIQAPEGTSDYAALFFRVQDIDGTLEKAAAHGARIIVPRRRNAAGTDVAIISTPQGLVVGIVQL